MIIAAVRTYQFTPGKRLEVITFEVKPNLVTAFEGVYEALAHSVCAHRSYLAVNVKEYKEGEEMPDERIIAECDRHGVGYILSTTHRITEHYEVDNFIRKQLSSQNQDQLRELLQ